MKRISSCLVVLCACLMVVTLPAWGTQVQYMSVEQLGEDSSALVRGTVAEVRSFWNDNHTKIFTATIIAVDESYKGHAAGTVEVVQIGGTVDNVQVTAHGALHWTTGEGVVLFLKNFTEGRFQVAGFSQGEFNIERDLYTGAAYIRRPALEGAQMVGAPGGSDACPPCRMTASWPYRTWGRPWTVALLIPIYRGRRSCAPARGSRIRTSRQGGEKTVRTVMATLTAGKDDLASIDF